ncbi:MAG: SAM-dependent methyltransferase [Bacteroidales bacterium]|jgi:16S rRNA (cytidine1402-2'-O)-methyltransferase|nr:SAM-dependent methyltransferase [Bacteroidales bacterium]
MPKNIIHSDISSGKGKLYLIPSLLGNESDIADVIPQHVQQRVLSTKVFIVEELKTARRFLKKLHKEIDIDSLEFLVYNEHTLKTYLQDFIYPLLAGKDVALLSEAGLPCVADPGSEIVAEAHRRGIEVIPLTGPSSIMLALIASGFNGQNFAFHGYLPVDKNIRAKKIRQLEQKANQNQQTQIFIETPYRNNQLLQTILENCCDDTMLCMAADITLPSQKIISEAIKIWKKKPFDFHKRPSVFLISR